VSNIPARLFAKSGVSISALGFGGHHLGAAENQQVAVRLVSEAIDGGITFFDNRWEYHDGVSEERMGIALQGSGKKAVLMTKVCTHGRDKNVAMRIIEESLRRLRTDYLDIWQIHEVVYWNDPDLIFAPNAQQRF
jgi:aryl-alcohol dehydrogenase-like predicted oxidoreductase